MFEDMCGRAFSLADYVGRWPNRLCRLEMSEIVSCTRFVSQSRELLVAPGTGSLLFDQPLLEKIVLQLKEDSLIASSVQLWSAVICRSTGRCGSTRARILE